MDAFMVKTLKKLKSEAPRKLKELHGSVESMLVALGETEEKNRELFTVDEHAYNCFVPLQLACVSGVPRLMEIALIALHYLFEHGFIRGEKLIPSEESPDAEPKSPKKLMDLVVEVVCKCADEFDDGVQLQVIKVVLTAVTSTFSEVHEGSLLLAIRACFHIHLVSKSPVTKTTAKAALTQMLSVINQRMELYESRSKYDRSSAHITVTQPPSQGSSSETVDGAKNEVKSSTATDSLEYCEESDEKCAVASENIANSGKVDGEADLASGAEQSKQPSNQFPSLFHRDAYLVFRALCKLSMKGLYDDNAAFDSVTEAIALQNKLLSLELIFHVLQNCGPSFRSGERFIYAIRHYLCVSLLGNCTSQVNQVVGLSLQIFISLLDGFKDHLKSELEVFVTNIFLKVLESENTSFDHKMRVLEVFHILCTEPSALVEIFMNYDCELEAIDLYRRIVNGFARIAKSGRTSGADAGDFMVLAGTNRRAIIEEHSIRVKGLEGLVIVLRSLLRSANLWQGEQNTQAAKGETNNSAVGDVSSAAGETGDMEDSLPLRTLAVDAAVPGVPSTSASPNNASGSVVDIFDRKQKFQEEIELGILKFNLSPKKGLSYLVQAGHIEMSPASVAAFFRQYQDRLDKTAVGEYLGREREYEDGFCIKVLHEYVDAMDFTGMKFDLAIRYFLNGFRLPGEAQKIDRLMEKFAERYYLQNRDVFASADMAFILAFSTIMLQTNLHNPAIREEKKMTKEQFLKQNKGISSDGELPEDMLLDIYDRIAAEPISITSNESLKVTPKKEESFSAFVPSADQRRKDAFLSERKEMVRAGEAMFKQKSGRGSIYVRVAPDAKTDEMYARPMFEVVWAPILAVVSELLEMTDDSVVVSLCINCFQYAIRLACRLDFPTPRHTFINALAKFTTLNSVKEMQGKNIECIRLLLDVATSEGDFLEDSWTQVFHSISRLSRLQLFASGSHTDEVFFGSNRRRSESQSPNSSSHGFSGSASGEGFALAKLFSGPTKAESVRAVEESNAELVSREIDHFLIDRIYTNSKNLSAESVTYFVKCLCEVSSQEITASSHGNAYRGTEAAAPRVFSLQKLVEVADCNMGSRPRIAWSNIWTLLAAHFTAIGVHENSALAMFAIDSLKQLSIKFLQKEELSNFNFQRLFLKPFEIIMVRSASNEIKDLVLHCIEIMIRACAVNIRSGWKSILTIFEVAAGQLNTDIAAIAFDIIDGLVVHQFELLIFDFVELVNCLTTFAASHHSALSLRALDHLARCADHLARGDISPAVESLSFVAPHAPSDHRVSDQIDEDSSAFRLWWPLLLGLSGRVGDSRLAVRRKALEILSQILKAFGHTLSPQTWKVIFKGVLFPMIDSARTDSTPQPQSKFPMENPSIPPNNHSWIGTMAPGLFGICVDLFHRFRDKMDKANLLPDLVNFLSSCVNQDVESLARLAANGWNDLVVGLEEHAAVGAVLDSQIADLICQRTCHCVLSNICLDYGEGIGYISFVPGTPEAVRQLVTSCPIARRRDGGELQMTMKSFLEASQSQKSQESAHKARESVAEDEEDEEYVHVPRVENSSPKPTRYTDEESWQELAKAAMTSMVISLEFLKIVREMFRLHSRSWELQHVELLLTTVEACHWHARSFNDNSLLRENLQQLRFIRFREDGLLLPHLLEQEINALSLILEVVFRLYLGSAKAVLTGSSEMVPIESEKSVSTTIAAAKFSLIDDAALEAFSAPWVKRIAKLVVDRYLSLELLLQSTSAERHFTLLQHQQYKSCVVNVLKHIPNFSDAQLRANKDWLLPSLSSLILCDNKQVRMHVSSCYSVRINPAIFPSEDPPN